MAKYPTRESNIRFFIGTVGIKSNEVFISIVTAPATAAAGKPFSEAVARRFDAERSPDLMLVPKPGWFLGSGAAGTTHGSPHEYDSHVPVMFYGAGRIGAAQIEERIDLIDLAPTLARLLGIDAPADAEGRARALPGLEK